MLTHRIIGMFGAFPADPHRYTKFRKRMLGLKNKGGAWTSELLILFLLHDITVLILLGPSAFAPPKEDAFCCFFFCFVCLFVLFCHTTWLVGSYFPDQRLNPGPQESECANS